MTRYLIIGNGIAANSAAESLRAQDQQGAITMVTREGCPFYYTPALPEYLAGEKDLKGITIHPLEWYSRRQIDLRLNTTVTSIDPDAHCVVTASGEQIAYDRLLLAAGGHSFVPPIPGADHEGVYTLRTVADADAIRTRLTRGGRLVLIGGGLLGLEAGNGLRKAGMQVTVVEFFPRLLPRQMDTDGATMLQQRMEQMGFSFFLGARTKEITPDNRQLAVRLESGETLPADMVLISAGVRPELELARQIALPIDKGIKVDDTMQTAAKDIFAAGDIIEHRERYYGIWPAAMEQGRTAGMAMAGVSAPYQCTVPANTLKVVGISLTAAGDIDADSEQDAVVYRDTDEGIYRKFVINDNILAGVILLGDDRGSEELLQAIRQKRDVSDSRDALQRPDFDFSQWKR